MASTTINLHIFFLELGRQNKMTGSGLKYLEEKEK